MVIINKTNCEKTQQNNIRKSVDKVESEMIENYDEYLQTEELVDTAWLYSKYRKLKDLGDGRWEDYFKTFFF